MAVIDSYSEANADSETSPTGGFHLGQSFTGDGKRVTSVQFYLRKQGSPTGNLTAKIYAHSGTFGTDGVPTGSSLGDSATVAASSVGTSAALVAFTFTGGPIVGSGTKYFVVLEHPDFSFTDVIYMGLDVSSPSHGGNTATFDSGGPLWNPSSAQDLVFYVHGDVVSTPKRGGRIVSQSIKRASIY